MDKNAAKAASSIALSKDLLGTDALTIPKLFNVDGWRCIGGFRRRSQRK